MADVEHKLEDLHHAIERRLEEQGALLMQHAGLEQDVARREQQASNVRRCHNALSRSKYASHDVHHRHGGMKDA